LYNAWKSRAAAVAIAASLVVPALALASSAGAAGNSGNAKSCQKDGWKTLARADNTAFKSQGECVSYATQGGTLVPLLPDLIPVLSCAHSGCSLSIENVGVAAANGSIGWTLNIDEVGPPGNFCQGTAAISLAPGATSDVIGSCFGNALPMTPVAALATATVDTTNAIVESNETNNTISQPFTLVP